MFSSTLQCSRPNAIAQSYLQTIHDVSAQHQGLRLASPGALPLLESHLTPLAHCILMEIYSLNIPPMINVLARVFILCIYPVLVGLFIFIPHAQD